MDILDDAWFTLRLSLRCPERVPTWDAILLTAASPRQEELFQLRLDRAKSQGTLPASTLAMAVSDPQGQRVGSGAATLCALRALSNKLDSTGGTWKGRPISEMRVLLLHTGGDSQRVPWANAIGKAFLPFPAQADPDGPAPTLFDHIFAISLHVVPAFGGAGGVFIMTGDVLPCFRATAMALPENGVCVVTVPATPDLASHHGVILSKVFSSQEPVLVEDLLQKPSLDEMAWKGAIGPSGEVLLDTGMFAVRGEACTALIDLALLEPDPVSSLLDSGQQLSLYEEMAGAWVLARHQWLLSRPLGKQLIKALGSNRLYHYCARDLTFLHFGTSTEVLDHLSQDQSGRVLHQHFSVFPYPLSSCEVAASAVIIASEISEGSSVGRYSVIYNCSLGKCVHIGSRCLVMGMRITEYQASSQKPGMVAVPDDSCLWEVPLRNASYDRINLCCGTRDNPKAPYGGQGSTFLGEAWETFLPKMGIQEENLWGQESNSKCKNLWNAHLFPLGPPDDRLSFSLWLLGAIEPSSKIAQDWRKCIRLSLADLHGETDFVRLHTETVTFHAKLAERLARANIADGAMTRDFSKLSRILEGESGIAICKELLNACSSVDTGDKEQAPGVPASRLYQVQADLARASGEEDRAVTFEAQALRAISAETEAVARMNRTDELASKFNLDQLAFSAPITTVLPVRLDISGGWSDTPPWSLERRGRVLNMAALLNGAAPIGAKVCATLVPGICLSDDAGNKAIIKEFDDITTPLQSDDPFRLVKAALVVTGFAGGKSKILLPDGVGLEIQTWSNVPRGSGLGTSSILAAAVVKSLLRLRGGDEWQSEAQIARLVLVLEQVMGSGGGWQDQVGGLYPGIKCTTGIPGQTQLQLNVEEISLPTSVLAELEQRMVVVFTGQVRQAVTVLEKVVRRYLQRDAVLIRSIERLTGLAQQGQECLHLGNLDKLGEVMSQTWKLNQELDPFCSNPGVDKLFRDLDHLTCGHKLAGAGGGGFGFLMAKDQDAAEAIKAKLRSHSVQVFHWTLANEMKESP